MLNRVEGRGRRVDPRSLPGRLSNPWDHALQRKLAEANTTHAEPAQVRTRTSASAAAIVLPHRELRLPLALLDHGFTGHLLVSRLFELIRTVLCLVPYAAPRPFFSSVLNGIPNSFNSANAWSSRVVLVTKVMSIP